MAQRGHAILTCVGDQAPVIADRGLTAQFLASRGIKLDQRSAETISRRSVGKLHGWPFAPWRDEWTGDYSPDELPKQFPDSSRLLRGERTRLQNHHGRYSRLGQSAATGNVIHHHSLERGFYQPRKQVLWRGRSAFTNDTAQAKPFSKFAGEPVGTVESARYATLALSTTEEIT